jgi:DNA-directed RNA polymerase specialized sigma24 family protein
MNDPIPAAQRLLVLRCQLGERPALEELVRTWERPLLFYVRRLIPAEPDALHVLQDVWVKVFSSIGRLRDLLESELRLSRRLSH